MTCYGPNKSDYTNVRALNREFLRLVRTNPGYIDLDEPQQARLIGLRRQQTERLEKTPFLLFSLHQQDGSVWQQLLLGDRNHDLFRQPTALPAGISNLLTATVGFLWQLARSNAYAVRILSGAGPDWCELIAAVTYFELVSRVGHRGDLLQVRRAASADIWEKLLDAGVSPDQPVRAAAHLAVLQTLLTSDPDPLPGACSLAACNSRSPHLQVAEGHEDR